MHIGDPDAGMLTAIAIVGGGIPVAAGYALAFQYLKQDRVAVCFFGDGGANEGIFHETLKMADLWNLPAIFVCENNLNGASTAVGKVMKIKHIRTARRPSPCPVRRWTETTWRKRTAPHGAPSRAPEVARGRRSSSSRPRFAGHSRSDPGHYRPASEVEAWKENGFPKPP